MLPKLFEFGIGITRSLGELLGNEIDIVVSDHEIKIEMVNPDEIDSAGRAWDDSHFIDGNIHLEGIANPIKPTLDEDSEEQEVITSERYKTYMKNKLMKDIVAETTDSSGLTLFHVLVILTTVQFSLTGAILYFLIF